MSDPGRRNLLSRMVAASVVVLPLATGVQGPAASQSALTEDELERISREIAIEAVKFASLRWPPNRFPLRVSFASGESLKQTTDCADQWRRQYGEYLQFINVKQSLLTAASINGVLDAYVFFGSHSELQASPAYKRGIALIEKLGLTVQSRFQDRYSHSFQSTLGVDQVMEFASAFVELDGTLDACTDIRLEISRNFASILLPSYAEEIESRVVRMFGDRADPTLEWRAHRCLLSAMSWLPDSPMDTAQYKRAMIRSLSDE